MMKRTILLISLLLFALLLFCACGTQGSPQTVKPEPAVQAAEPSFAPAPQETAEVPADEPEPEEEEVPPEVFDPDVTFTTTDREGNSVDETIFAGASLTILNFWEPWCGPCVQEMPELEKLYEDYREKGLQIVGVYSTTGMEADVDEVLDYAGTTYPILHYADAFDTFQTGYVPTTVFINGQGQVVGDTVIGSKSYGQWEILVQDLMP